QFGHETLSTFGIGAELSEAQWRTVLRQLVALGAIAVEGEFQTLVLAGPAKAVLKGDVPLRLRVPSAPAKRDRVSRAARSAGPVDLDADAQQRFAALKAWRAAVAREHDLPAYVVFHDATLAEMARALPANLIELAQI